MAVKAQNITTRTGITKKAPTPGSKTQKRKAGKAKHMQGTRKA
jgi:hypothetical protein